MPNSENKGMNISRFEGILEICSLLCPQHSGQCWHMEDLLNRWVKLVSRRSHFSWVFAVAYTKCCIYKPEQEINLFWHSIICFMYYLLLAIKKEQAYFCMCSQNEQTPLNHSICLWWNVSKELKTYDISNIGSEVPLFSWGNITVSCDTTLGINRHEMVNSLNIFKLKVNILMVWRTSPHTHFIL